MWQIPTIGTEIELLQDWTFGLYQESRNSDLLYTLPAKDPQYPNLYDELNYAPHAQNTYPLYSNICAGPYTLKQGTILVVDRIYIRKGFPDFDSLSFRIQNFGNLTVQTLVRKWHAVPIQTIPAQQGLISMIKASLNNRTIGLKTNYVPPVQTFTDTIKSRVIKRPRFWAKLTDVRNMDIRVIKY